MSQYTAITPQQFANKAWQRCTSYAFAAAASLIPVVAAELAKLAPALPLGFVQTDAAFELVAITSLQPDANLLVAPNGDWLGRYIPAALRGHPFRVVKTQGKDESILCIDESSGLVVEAGRGEAFFDEGGQPAQALKDMLDFISLVEANRVVTQTAVDALQAADLFQTWPLSMQNGDRTVAVEGLYRIDEAKLNAISGDVFLSLRATGGLPLAYAQLLSMNQLEMLQMAGDVQTRLRAKGTQQPQNLDWLAGSALSDHGTLRFS